MVNTTTAVADILTKRQHKRVKKRFVSSLFFLYVSALSAYDEKAILRLPFPFFLKFSVAI